MALASRTQVTAVLSLITSFSALVLGVIASVLLVVILPLQLAGLFGGPMSWSASVTWLA